jgi:predicted  nucleic acid-binding Zn-ribbon protein
MRELKIEKEAIESKVNSQQSQLVELKEKYGDSEQTRKDLSSENKILQENHLQFEQAFEKLMEEKEDYQNKFSELIEHYEELEKHSEK